jgi:hypothetical protein
MMSGRKDNTVQELFCCNDISYTKLGLRLTFGHPKECVIFTA